MVVDFVPTIRCGMHLHWYRDPHIFVTATGDGHVIHDGRVRDLGDVTREILGREVRDYRPYWCIGGYSLENYLPTK